MKHSNIVRFKPKKEAFDAVIAVLSEPMNFEGLLHSFIVKTSVDTCCSIGIWESETHIANARPKMIALLDRIRDQLDTISEETGLTDPLSGPIIHED